MWGYAFGHPRLPDGMHIHTSAVRSIKMNDAGDKLSMHTKSDNDYELALSDICFENAEKTQDNLQAFDVPAFTVERCQELKELTEDEMIAKVDKIIECNELYLLQFGVATRCAYFKNEKGIIHKHNCLCHSGMI